MIYRKFLRSSILAFVASMVGQAFAFVVNLYLANSFGVEMYGFYGVLTSTVVLLSIISGVGLQFLVLKNVSKYSSIGNYSLAVFELKKAEILTTYTCCIVLMIFLFLNFTIRDFSSDVNPYVLIALLIQVFLYTKSVVRQQTLRALGKVVWFRFPELFVFNAVLLIFTFVWNLSDNEFGEVSISFFRLLGVAVALLFGKYLVEYILEKNSGKKIHCFQSPKKTSSVIRIKYSAAMLSLPFCDKYIGGIDVIFVGSVLGVKEAGIYFAATKISLLVNFGMGAVNTAIAPMLATIPKGGSDRGIKLLIIGAFVASIIGFFSVIAIYILGDSLLSIFGSEFSRGSGVLIVLVIAQVINCLFSHFDMSLVMRGQHKVHFLIVSFGYLVSLSFQYIWMQSYGLIGAAFAAVLFVCIVRSLSVTMVLYRMYTGAY